MVMGYAYCSWVEAGMTVSKEGKCLAPLTRKSRTDDPLSFFNWQYYMIV